MIVILSNYMTRKINFLSICPLIFHMNEFFLIFCWHSFSSFWYFTVCLFFAQLLVSYLSLRSSNLTDLFTLHCLSSRPAELSARSTWFGQCTRQPDVPTTPTSMWFTWSMWLYVLQSHTLVAVTCQSTWLHRRGPSLSCLQTGKGMFVCL